MCANGARGTNPAKVTSAFHGLAVTRAAAHISAPSRLALLLCSPGRGIDSRGGGGNTVATFQKYPKRLNQTPTDSQAGRQTDRQLANRVQKTASLRSPASCHIYVRLKPNWDTKSHKLAEQSDFVCHRAELSLSAASQPVGEFRVLAERAAQYVSCVQMIPCDRTIDAVFQAACLREPPSPWDRVVERGDSVVSFATCPKRSSDENEILERRLLAPSA